MSYKIKIQCTHTPQLSFKGKNINKKIIQNIRNMMEEVPYVDRVVLVTRKILNPKRFTYMKSLEFYCDDILDENGLTNFVDKIKQFGFESKENTNVKFIEVKTNEHIHIMEFNSNVILQSDDFVGKTRRSEYSTLVIYKK